MLKKRAGVREYWIIDPDEKRATFLRLVRRRFREVEPTGDVFESKVLRGFRIEVKWQFAKRRPAVRRVANDLLG